MAGCPSSIASEVSRPLHVKTWAAGRPSHVGNLAPRRRRPSFSPALGLASPRGILHESKVIVYTVLGGTSLCRRLSCDFHVNGTLDALWCVYTYVFCVISRVASKFKKYIF